MVRRRQRRRLPSGHHRPPPKLDDAVRLAVDDDGRLCLAPPIIVKPIDRQCNDRIRLIHTACLRPLPPRSLSTTTTTTLASARTPMPSSPNRDPPRRPSSLPSTSSTPPALEAAPPSLQGCATWRRAVATRQRPIGDTIIVDMICGRGQRQ